MFSRSAKHFVWFFLFVTAFLAGGETAYACSCLNRPTVLDSFDRSDVVIRARAISVEKVPDDEEHRYVFAGVRSTTMVVEKVFKGNLKVKDEIVFGQGSGADCIWAFDKESIGHEFLFYLSSPDKYSDRSRFPFHDPPFWYAGVCGRSRGLSDAGDDLLYLENMSKVRGKTRISGTINNGHHPAVSVENRKIKIIGEKKTYQIESDKNGVFEIYDLPPGKYLIEPEVPPGWKIEAYVPRTVASLPNAGEAPDLNPNRVEIVLEAKKHTAVDFGFKIDNRITGRVLDPEGKPMYRVCVHALTAEQKEGFGSPGCTNEKGEFQITSISEGDYVLVINGNGKLSNREPFARFYYPSVTERERAAVISIGPGESFDDINIVVPKLAETITIEGVLRYSDGNPVAEKWVRFNGGDDEKTNGHASEQTDAAGRFSLKVLKGLIGELSAEDWLWAGQFKSCPKVDELIAKTAGTTTTVSTNVIKLETNQNYYDIELTFPFPRCEKANDKN
jgi:hypothetical protein